MQFKIDREIENLLPALSPEEYAGLSLSIGTDGCRDPLVILNIMGQRILGDGHNRYRICKEKGIPYRQVEIKLPSRELAIQWVIDNQLGRRNLTDERRAYYRGLEYRNTKHHHGGHRAGEGATSHSETLPGDTAARLAEKHGVSRATIHRDATFSEAVDKIGEADPQAKKAILDGQGATKKELLNTAAPPLLCRRCRTQRARPGCKDCAAMRPLPSGQTRKPGKHKTGQVILDRRAFSKALGELIRAVDKIGSAYGCKETREAKQLRQDLGDWSSRFKLWHQVVSAPKVKGAP
jgi:hypothetical protein